MAKAQRVLDECMTVEDLVKVLKQHDPKSRVFFEYPAHDHARSQLAGGVETVEDETIVWSDYHESFKIPDERGRDDGEQLRIVILR